MLEAVSGCRSMVANHEDAVNGDGEAWVDASASRSGVDGDTFDESPEKAESNLLIRMSAKVGHTCNWPCLREVQSRRCQHGPIPS